MTKLLTGFILESQKTKVYNHWPNCLPLNCQEGCRYYQEFYRLKVKIEHKPLKTISAFTDKLVDKEKILKVLENNQFLDKRYSFDCVTHYGNYHLIDWEELPSNGNDFDKSRQLSPNPAEKLKSHVQEK